jgi:hypothetical protein
MNISDISNSSSSNISRSLADIPYGTLLYWNVYFNNLTNSINYWFLAFAIPIGAVSNLLAYIVYSRKRLNKTNIGFFNKSMAIFNMFTLLFSLLMYSGLFFPFDFNSNSDFSCQFIMYSRKAIREFGPLLETLFTLDQFLNVIYPGKFFFMKKNRNILLIILGILAFLLLVNGVNFEFYVETKRTSFLSTRNLTMMWITKSCMADIVATLTSDMILCTLRCFLPMVVMGILNVFIVRKLKQSSKMRTVDKNSQENKDEQFTRTLVRLNALFATLNLPLATIYVIKDAYFYIAKPDMAYILINFAWAMSFNLATLHYVHFFFLNLYFNRLFRQELMIIVYGSKRVQSSSMTNNYSVTANNMTRNRKPIHTQETQTQHH